MTYPDMDQAPGPPGPYRVSPEKLRQIANELGTQLKEQNAEIVTLSKLVDHLREHNENLEKLAKLQTKAIKVLRKEYDALEKRLDNVARNGL